MYSAKRLRCTLFALPILLTLTSCHTITREQASAPETEQIQSARYVPSHNRALLFVGQDSDTIAAYLHDVPEDKLEGFTLYSPLKSAHPQQTLQGWREAANWNSGDINFARSLADAPNAALAVGLSFDRCNQAPHGKMIAQGEYDASIDYMARMIKDLAPRPVFLRIGYEFDGPWNCYEQSDYKQAFRHIVERLRQQSVDNFVSVWQSAAWPKPSTSAVRPNEYDHRNPAHLNDWYPGDDVVDWVSMSAFYRDLHQWNSTPEYSPELAQQAILAFARQHEKPVMIAEAAPQAYRTGALTKGYIDLNQSQPVSAQQVWDNWYAKLFSFIDANRDVIKALAYINTHWESQGMWFCEDGAKAGDVNCPQGFWGDSRVQANPLIREKWLAEIQDQNKWVQTPWW